MSVILKRLPQSSAALAERMIERRGQLDLTQAQVAEQVVFWNDKKQEWVRLSRSAYCVYELGDVVPDLDKIERIAMVLKCDPAWLAFGRSNTSGVLSCLPEKSAAIAERMVARRHELGLTQAQVAEQVVFWNDKKQEWVRLSRTAYCMYEAGEVVPDIHKVEQFAMILKCDPAWLAFGVQVN